MGLIIDGKIINFNLVKNKSQLSGNDFKLGLKEENASYLTLLRNAKDAIIHGGDAPVNTVNTQTNTM